MAYTEHAAKTAVFILMDVYDNLRLWWLPAALIEGIRRLSLLQILGNNANVQELHRLLRVIETTEFEKLPPSWRHRTRRKDGKELSADRRGPGADWVYYDPWHRKKVDEETAMKIAFTPILMPENHPVKLDYVREIPEYTWEDIARPVAEPAEVVTDDSDYEDDKDDDSNWNAAIAAARQEGRRQGIASATMAHLQSFPRFPSYGVGSANSSAAPSAATSVPIAGPSTFVPTQYSAAVPNANPYAAYAPVLPVTPVPSVTQAILTQNFQIGQVPQPVQVPAAATSAPATSVDPRCEGLRTVLGASGFSDSELPNNFAVLSQMVQSMMRDRRLVAVLLLFLLFLLLTFLLILSHLPFRLLLLFYFFLFFFILLLRLLFLLLHKLICLVCSFFIFSCSRFCNDFNSVNQAVLG